MVFMLLVRRDFTVAFLLLLSMHAHRASFSALLENEALLCAVSCVLETQRT